MSTSIRQIVSLLKLRIGVFMAASAVAGMAATTGGAAPLWKIAALSLAVLGASGAAGAFNHYYERDSDRLMERTRLRPFAVGAFQPGFIWPLSFFILLAASLALAYAAGGGLASLYVFLGAFTYGIVYTVWLKRRSVWNIVVGGLAGSFAVLAGAAAVDPSPQVAPVILAVVLFLWTPPHFWSLAAAKSDDYARAGVPMLPVKAPQRAWTLAILSHTLLLSVLALVPAAYGMGTVYTAGAAIGGALFSWRSIVLWKHPNRATAMKNFAASLVQLLLLIIAILLDAATGHSTWPF